MSNSTTTSNRRCRRDAIAAIHERIEALHGIEAISRQIMRDFDETCLTPAEPLRPGEIRPIREREHVGQTVFANCRNVTISLVNKWERGENKPSGAALRLLSLVEKADSEPLPGTAHGPRSWLRSTEPLSLR